MELMSPSGNRESFYAAVAGGADAVYLGLGMFNARRPARNFTFEEIPEVIAHAHSKNVRVYITLNIDLKSSELEDAAKIVQFLKESKADAVIVKDMALIRLIERYFSPFEFHLSTQFGISNSAGMYMAEKLGASRVVLARELNIDEIRVLSEPFYPGTEVFIQGSMCFSFSGRCLMSSWFGGKSANRGTCQAPCRFRFEKDGTEGFSPYFSMKDLNLSERLKELEASRVAALKIEGRLKSAEWVGETTKYYRSMLNGIKPEGFDPTQFTGREQGEGFFGSLSGLITSRNSGTVKSVLKSTPDDRKDRQNTYDLNINAAEVITIGIFTDMGSAEYKTKIKRLVNDSRGILLSELENRLADISFGNLFLGEFELDNDILIAKSQLNNIVSELGAIITPMTRKESKFLKRIKLNHKLEHELHNPESDAKNTIEVNFKNANVLKISSSDIGDISGGIRDAGIKKLIVTNANSSHIEKIRELSNRIRVEISLFPILFENDLEDYRKIISALEHTNNISYEANDISHLRLLKGTSKKIDCGPGLSPYNFMAVRQLKELGAASAHIPLESDIETLDGLKASSLPLRMTIFSKIPLFYSRAVSDNFCGGSSFRERENFRFAVSEFNGISIFHSKDYFSAYGIDLSFLKVHEIIIDLTGETGIIKKFHAIKNEPSKFPGVPFNLIRKLY
jgi:U32 family peptidase